MEIKVGNCFYFFTSYKDLSKKGIYLREGSKIDAKVIGKFGQDYIIRFNNYNFLAESNISLKLGEILSLFVKEIKDNKIILSIDEITNLQLLNINNVFTKYILQGLPLLNTQLEELQNQLIITNNKSFLFLLSNILLKEADLEDINLTKNFIMELLVDNYFSLRKIIFGLKELDISKNIKIIAEKIIDNIDTQVLQNSIFIKNKIIPFYMQLPIYTESGLHNVELKIYQELKKKPYNKKSFNIALLFTNLSFGYLKIILTDIFNEKFYIRIYVEAQPIKKFIIENIEELKNDIKEIGSVTVLVNKNLSKEAILFRLPEEFYNNRLSTIDLKV